MFGESAYETRKSDGEAMLVKDEEGHMVLLAHQIEGAVEIEKKSMKVISPIFGKRSCMYFSKVAIKDNLPVLVLNLPGIREDANSVSAIKNK